MVAKSHIEIKLLRAEVKTLVCTKDSGTNNVLVNPCLTFYKLTGLLASPDLKIFGFYNKKQKNEKKMKTWARSPGHALGPTIFLISLGQL